MFGYKELLIVTPFHATVGGMAPDGGYWEGVIMESGRKEEGCDSDRRPTRLWREKNLRPEDRDHACCAWDFRRVAVPAPPRPSTIVSRILEST